jgi:PhzF family phenazine biosynthesis protein
MKLKLYQIEAFTRERFKGNPAAVCPLDDWLDDDIMQKVAAENNLSETAFFVKTGDSYALRWFTPAAEVDLCGHATLAAAFVVFNFLELSLKEINFSTRSGTLTVKREADLLAMDFPSRPAAPCPSSQILADALGVVPEYLFLSRDYLAVYEKEETVAFLKPDMGLLARLDNCLGVIVTAPGRDVDFVSRFFAPRVGVPEDPVTGSSHCTLVPYWSSRLNKKSLHARQLSSRGGELFCEDMGDRVRIAGNAVIYLEGMIRI